MTPRLWKFVASLTPTYLLYRLLKKYAKDTDTYTLSEWFDNTFLILTFVTALVRYAWEKTGTPYTPLFLCLAVIQASRCIEIPTAFLSDSLDTLRNPRRVAPAAKAKEPRYLRIKLSITVYFELILNYALLYTLMPGDYWSSGGCPAPNELVRMGVLTASGSLSTMSALYYSVATMTTLGYGDIVPLSDLARFCSVVQVLSSIILVVMSIAIYGALGAGQTNHQRPLQQDDEQLKK